MKKFISILLTFALLIGIMPVYATEGEQNAEAENMLTDGGFENVENISENWKFSNTGTWYRGGTAAIDTDTVKGGAKSVTLTDAIVGQKVTLEANKAYRFEIHINATAAAYIDAGFFTASSSGAITTVKTPDNKKIETVNDWVTVTVDYTPASDGSYVAGVYNQSKKYTADGTFLTSKPSSGWPAGTKIYIDDAKL